MKPFFNKTYVIITLFFFISENGKRVKNTRVIVRRGDVGLCSKMVMEASEAAQR